MTDTNANSFLAIASQDLKEGRILPAHTIATGLCKIDFFRKAEARVTKTIATMHKHPPSVYQTTVTEMQKIVDDQELQSPTVARGAAYLGIAWAQIGLENYEEAGWSAEKAAEVFTQIGANPELGDVIYVQALLEVAKGNLNGAIEMFRRSKSFNGINPTRALRVSHDGFEDGLARLLETESFETELAAFAGSTT